MHQAVRQWVAQCVQERPYPRVLELGGRDVNGGVRDLVPHEEWHSVDIANGPGVDTVADASLVSIGVGTWDLVVSTEVFEHTPLGREITANAFRHLRHGGAFVATMAGPGRGPHGASGEPSPPPGEHYANVEPEELLSWLIDAGFVDCEVEQQGADVRCWGVKP